MDPLRHHHQTDYKKKNLGVPEKYSAFLQRFASLFEVPIYSFKTEQRAMQVFVKLSLLVPQRYGCEVLHRKEVIQPHLPIRLPCYDFTPIIYPTFGGWPLAVTSPTSGVVNSRGVTGGVYKTRERIHRGMLIRDY